MDSTNIVGFDHLPSRTQAVLDKLGNQIEALVPESQKEIHQQLVDFLVGISPTEYADGDLPARHLAAGIVTYFNVTAR